MMNTNLSVPKLCTDIWNENSVNVDNAIYIINAVLNFIFCIPTSLINLVMFVAIWKPSTLRMPSNVLISALAATNFFVGLASQPAFAITNINIFVLPSNTCVFPYLNGILANLFCCMSFLVFTAISVDQLLMIQLHLRYNTLVTNKRTTISLVALFLFSGLFTALIFINKNVYVIWLVIIICSCFIIASLSYIKIYRTVIRHHQEIHDQAMAVAEKGSNNSVLQFARFKKRAFNMMCLYIVFLCSYFPFLCTAVLLQTNKDQMLTQAVKTFALTMIFFNSLINPLLICWKMRDIRKAMKRLICFICKNT